MTRMLRAFSALILLLAPLAAEGGPLRVATLLPFIEDVVELIPANAQLVATVPRSVLGGVPEGALDLGSSHNPNLEILHASAPDIVVLDPVSHAGWNEKLSRGPWRILPIQTRSVDETLEGIVEVGRKAGAEEAVNQQVDSVRESLLAQRLFHPVRALVVFVAPGSPMVVTERTWLGDLVRRLGFEHAAAASSGSERFPGYVALSDERLATLAPEIVFLVTHGDSAELEDSFRRRMRSSAAWRSVVDAADAVVALDPLLFSSNPGLQLPRAAERLVRLATPVQREDQSAAPPGP